MSTAALAVVPGPRGWDVVVAAGPIAREDAVCACGARAVAATPRHWICANHPPQPGDWGYGLDWSPRPLHPASHPLKPHRCYEARCPRFAFAGENPRPATDELSRRRHIRQHQQR